VRHPNVCSIHEYGQDGHLRFIVMEFVGGVDLKQVLRTEGPMAWPQAYEVAVQVADGLQAIHNVGIVHRDLKTPNIMLDSHGAVRLMDFGIAKLFGTEGTTSATGTGHVVGTPEYMSPEQVRAEPVDARSDIYALGIVVYELFTANVPFRGDTPMATLRKQLDEAPPLALPAAARLPYPAKAIVGRALAKDRSDRYATAREMADDLRTAWSESKRYETLAYAPPRVRESVARDLAPRAEELTTPMPAAVPTPVPAPTPAPAPPTSPRLPMAAPKPAAPEIHAELSPPHPTAPPARSRRGVLVIAASIAAIGLAVSVGLALRGQPAAESNVAATLSPASLPPAETGAVATARDATATPPTTIAARTDRVTTAGTVTVKRDDRSLPKPSPLVAQRRPTPAAAAAPTSAATTPAQPADDTGLLRIVVKPFAEISINGRSVGTSPPLAPVRLPPGTYSVRLVHPDYLPLPKRVVVRAGETAVLDVDMAQDAFRK
jgi:serine/threonine-protein kinase